MAFYFRRIPPIFQLTFPNHLWRIPNADNKLFLTFDDGPVPGVTEFVLEELASRQMKATFFCLGENLVQYPELGRQIMTEGHLLANHGYAHLDGWKISKSDYQKNFIKGKEEVRKLQPEIIPVFRPPYGHSRRLGGEVMWSVMSGDFDQAQPKGKCLENLIEETKSGDVIVFHDNKKSHVRLQWVLPRYLDFCVEHGFSTDLIKSSHA